MTANFPYSVKYVTINKRWERVVKERSFRTQAALTKFVENSQDIVEVLAYGAPR